MQGSIETLTLAITGWMVKSSARLFNLVQKTELLDKRGFKTSALVRMNPARDPKLIKPLHRKNLGHSLGMLVPCRDSQGILVKTSVITKIFSNPEREGSSIVKSIARISFGLEANKWPIKLRATGCTSLADWHLSHSWHQLFTSEDVPGQ